MGRGKIEIKRIENPTNRQVTFSKRRGGLLKKANELAILCDAQVGVVIFSSSGKMFEYCSAPLSMQHLIDRYHRVTNTRFEEVDNQQQFFCEITRMKNESDNLEASLRQYMGEDLTSLTLNDLNHLEQQLEFAVNKVRARKQQLMNQQMDNLRRKEHILEDQNSYLYRIISAHEPAAEQQQQVMVEPKVADMAMLDHFQQFYSDEPSMTALQLSPQLHAFRLQPVQPNLQEANFEGHGLQL
ncbi:MADS-box transcription factor 29-like isoform X2 [Typha angustifolia]|uniref:MADS-box transcription factor 29-like n=1 Tax=Typha latifolia TaxID=4733 RepID=UPI003C2B2894